MVSNRDIVSGSLKPGANVLIIDDAGDHAALQAAETVAATGARVEIMTADSTFAPGIMGMNLVPHMRSLQKLDVTFTVVARVTGRISDTIRSLPSWRSSSPAPSCSRSCCPAS